MADHKNVDVAVLARLEGDATLASLCPGGIYLDSAPHGVAEPFGIVTLTSHEDEYQISGAGVEPAYESALYLVKFVKEGETAAGAQACASRAHTLLQRKHELLTPTGYRCLELAREERVAYVEVVEQSDRRFQHRGGFYRVIVEATA